MKTLTIRGIDQKLAETIRGVAEKNNDSINQTALKILREALGVSNHLEFRTYDDLDSLAGTWSEEDEKAFFDTTKDFERIDEELWK